MYKILILLLLLCSGCEKWLTKPTDESKFIPSDLKEFQLLLDNAEDMHATASLVEVGADNYQIPPNILASMADQYKTRYNWAANGWKEEDQWDWSKAYTAIYTANLCITGLEKIERTNTNKAEWDYVKGAAHYIRAMHYFYLESTFTYPEKNAKGVPLILQPDANIRKGRGIVSEVRNQINEDLQTALNFLPETNSSQYKFKPSKQATFGLLARIHLAWENYSDAFNYADKALGLPSYLLDYNGLPKTAGISFPHVNLNTEVIYFSQFMPNYLIQANVSIDSPLMASYAANDLRKDIFFRNKSGRMVFAGPYTGDVKLLFSGIATDELLLIRAECNARLNKITESMADLNQLMVKRYNKNSFTYFTASTQDLALSIILAERRKELIFRGTRWTDLRRLNKDPRFAVTIARSVDGVTYTLKPEDNKFAFPIPEVELKKNKIEQNPR